METFDGDAPGTGRPSNTSTSDRPPADAAGGSIDCHVDTHVGDSEAPVAGGVMWDTHTRYDPAPGDTPGPRGTQGAS